MREGDPPGLSTNANLFFHPAFDRPPQPVSYEGETVEQRVARRKRLWTPLLES